MILNEPIKTTRLLLRSLTPPDVGDHYLAWMQDPEVLRALEVRFNPVQGTAELVSFVQAMNASPDNLMLGIFLKDGDRHIGNIKLGPIRREHGRAEIGFLIGDRSSWGKGYASEAIGALSRYGIEVLGLAKVTSGCYATNIGSAKALIKAGFTQEAMIPSHVIFEGKRVASLLFGMDQSDPGLT